jgi:hypothetical protein
MLRHMNGHDTAAPAALNRADTADLVKRWSVRYRCRLTPATKANAAPST